MNNFKEILSANDLEKLEKQEKAFSWDIVPELSKSKDLFGGELVSESEFVFYVRNRFFEVFSVIENKAFQELRNIIFPHFEKAGMDSFTNPFFQTDLTWKNFEEDSEKLLPEQKSFRKALNLWFRKWNLTESNISEKWLIHWIIFNVFDHWKHSARAIKEKGITRQSRSRRKLLEVQIKPPFGLPFYNPSNEKRNDYFVRTKEELLCRLEKDSLFRLAENSHKNSLIQSVFEQLENDLKDYCEQVENYYLQNGWKRVPEKDLLYRNLVWTIQTLIQNKTYEEISQTGRIEISKDLIKKEFVNPLNLTRKHFEINEVLGNGKSKTIAEIVGIQKSTVLRAVKQTLEILNLKSHKEIKRTKNSKESFPANLLRNLGK